MSLEKTKKKAYVRPADAHAYLDFTQVYAGEWGAREEENVVLPALNKIRPAGNFGWYSENTSVNNAATEVICSGNFVLVGGNTGDSFGGNRIGLMKSDAIPGEFTTVITKGLVNGQLDWEGAASPARTAANTSGLVGKIAYYIIETGTFSDTAPNNSDYHGFAVGTFTGTVQLKQISGGPGLWWAEINLDSSLMKSNTAQDSPAAAGSVVNAAKLYAKAYVQSGYGLNVTFEVDAESSDPNNPILARHVTWVIDGTTYSAVGKEVTHTFSAAGAGKTVAVTITDDNAVTITKNYTVTITASAAPSAFTEV